MPDLHLADLSDWNPGANFDEYLIGGRPGVFLKATEGTSFVASTFGPYRAAAHGAGLTLVGLYHFARGNAPAVANLVRTLAPRQRVVIDPHWSVDGRGRYRYHRDRQVVVHDLRQGMFAADSPPAGEAGHFLDAIGTLQPGELAVLDAEVPGLSASWCRTFLGTVRDATGREPLLYGSWSYWIDVLGSMTDFPLWIAAYHSLGHDDPRDSVPGCLFWQFTDNAQIPGVGSGDDSVFRGSIDDLAALGGSSPTPPPPQPKEPEVSKTAFSVPVESGTSRRVPVPAIGGGMGWTKVAVNYASTGVQVTKAIVGPNERPISGLAPSGVETAHNFDGRSYVEMEAGDEWVEIELAPGPVGTLDLNVEASDATS